MKKKILSAILALFMVVTCLVSPAMANPAEAETSENPSESTMLSALYETADGLLLEAPEERDTTEVTIIVSVGESETVFLQTSDLELAVAAAGDQRVGLYAAENAIESALDRSVEVDHYFSLIFNGFSFTGESWMIDAINQINGLHAAEAAQFQLVEPESENDNVDLTPDMSTVGSFVGATNAWDLGYTGEGMVVAVIDTGIKQTHEAFSVEPKGARIDKAYLEDVFSKYGELMHGENPEGAYYSPKMPYNWDYFDGDHIPNHTGNAHGSHVAGIVAGNNGDDFKGVAPDAQIVSLQIFTKTTSASTADMLAAMEDAVYLGVDAINMSLGIANGFETYQWPIDFESVYNAMEKAGIAVCVAAGNDAHAYLSTTYGNWGANVWQWPSSNPDNGMVGTPGTYVGSFTVGNSGKRVKDQNFDYSKVSIDESSCWGPTAQLSLKPDISAPGINIMSVEGTANKADDAYVSKTGTSMATPAVAGGVLLMKQHLKTMFPNATAKELNELTYAFLMSTAGQANAFVRQQGSGVMNLEKALTTQTYLTTTEGKRPKLELDDSETGEFAISFKVHNAGTTDKTYDIGFIALTEDTFKIEYEGYHTVHYTSHITKEMIRKWGDFLLVNPTVETVTLCDGTMKDVAALCTLDGERTITVPAGQSVTVNMTLKAGESLMDYFAENCPSGMYLEGWIKLTDKTAENTADLTIPYLGFVGDWDYPAMIDEGWWWQDEYGVNNMSQFYVSNVRGGIFLGYGDAEQGLGLNWYWDETGETYLPDRNAISPNGDGYLDALTTIEFSLLRQPRRVRVYIQCDDSTQLMYDENYAFTRERHPYGATTSGLNYSALYFDYAAEALEENETATFVVEAYLDHDEFKLEDNKLAKLEIPFTKDTIAPVVTAVKDGVEIQDANYVAYYAIYADARRTEKVFEDGVFATERGVKETYTTDMDEYFVSVADYARNEAFYYVCDGVAYELDGQGFDHGRTIIGQTHRIHAGLTNEEPYFAWHAFSENLDQQPLRLTEVSVTSDDMEINLAKNNDIIGVGKTADGRVYASSMGFLYSFDPVTYEKTKIAEYYTEGQSKSHMYAFAVAPGTNELYGIVNRGSSLLSNAAFCSIDPETGIVTDLWPFKGGTTNMHGFAFYDSDTVIFLRNSGQRAFELHSVVDGSLEKTIDLGLVTSNGYHCLGSFLGFNKPMLYDETTDTIYLGGLYTANRRYREGEVVVMKINFTTGKINYMVPGSNGGKGMFAMYFQDEFVDIPEQEHITYLQGTVAPTCTSEGYTLKVCAECGMEVKENIVPALGHDYETVDTEPTCTTLGYTTYTCKTCGDTYTDNYVPATDHKYGDWQTVTAPTCTTKGQEKRVCECGAAEYRNTDMAGHDYEAVVPDPTCTTLGYTTYTCKVCGDSYKSDFVETIGHKYTEEVVAPTCTDMGYTIYTCDCGHRYEGNFVLPTGHRFGDWEVTKEATCIEKGEETRTCACGETETRATDKAEHTFEDVVTEPTCTEVGYTTHTCTVCGHNYITDLKQATGHDYEAVVTAPTCTEEGYTTYTCACGESYVDDYTDALGHTFGQWTESKAPACDVPGEETRTCEVCDATETRETATSCPAEDFTDVDTKQWYHEGVCYVLRNGLMNGKGEGIFAPNANLTRAELVTVLYRMAGTPSVEGMTHPFADVAAGTWYTDAVIWAYNAEVVKGISDTAFAPGANITREQIATILYRFSEAEAVEEAALADFADADKVSDWAVEAMNWAVSVGLINGVAEDTLAPQGNATRAQIATILMRYCEN